MSLNARKFAKRVRELTACEFVDEYDEPATLHLRDNTKITATNGFSMEN